MDDAIKRDQVKAVIEHFKGTPLTNEILDEYCKRNKYDPITADQYEDYVFAYNHDKRVDAALPDILAVLSKIKNVPEFASDKERESIMKANEMLQTEICGLLEKHDVLYQEIELLTGNLGTIIKGTLDGASRRTNNMAAEELLKVAEAKFGKPLTVKALGEFNREK